MGFNELDLNQLRPFSDYREASKEILHSLHKVIGFKLWMVTRAEGNDWIVLEAEDHGYRVKKGDVFCWSDSFCYRMVQGHGPMFAPDVSECHEYMSTPIYKQLTINAYIGVPLVNKQGDLFGTLCAIDTHNQPASILDYSEIVKTQARTLSTLLQQELDNQLLQTELNKKSLEDHTDPISGAFDIKAWQQLLQQEEDRCKEMGSPTSLVIIQNHENRIRDIAIRLMEVIRPYDIIAILSESTLGMLVVEINIEEDSSFLKRVNEALSSADINFNIAYGIRNAGTSLHDVMQLTLASFD